jgi:hypothetical protein
LRTVIQKEVGYLSMNALEFLKITRGSESGRLRHNG